MMKKPRHMILLLAAREDVESPLTRLRLLFPTGWFGEVRWTTEMSDDEKDAELEKAFLSLRAQVLQKD